MKMAYLLSGLTVICTVFVSLAGAEDGPVAGRWMHVEEDALHRRTTWFTFTDNKGVFEVERIQIPLNPVDGNHTPTVHFGKGTFKLTGRDVAVKCEMKMPGRKKGYSYDEDLRIIDDNRLTTTKSGMLLRREKSLGLPDPKRFSGRFTFKENLGLYDRTTNLTFLRNGRIDVERILEERPPLLGDGRPTIHVGSGTWKVRGRDIVVGVQMESTRGSSRYDFNPTFRYLERFGLQDHTSRSFYTPR